ncbi:MAG TPA: protein translocase subunit SecF [Burkholderiaceae bacterium]|nr:protein translocase subunit SecF [Burkholderiaceae bacterium]
MEFFRIHRTIPFMRYALIFNVISLITFLTAVGFLAFRGLNLSIEFTGGTVMEVAFRAPANLEAIRAAIGATEKGEFQVQSFGSAEDVLIRLPARTGFTSGQQAEQVFSAITAAPSAGEAPACEALHAQYAKFTQLAPSERTQEASAALLGAQRQLAGQCTELRRVEFVGPQVGTELAQDGAVALLMVVLGIALYLAIRFEKKFSAAAIIANLHDVVLVIGMFAIFRWEFSLPVLAAVLAVLGYSVNESVIIFDRVREHFRTMRKASVVEVIDSAITATISRTIITHGATLTMTVTMLLFGGPALHNFALALTLGIMFGVYSSVFVAAAIAKYLGVQRADLVRPVKDERAVMQ